MQKFRVAFYVVLLWSAMPHQAWSLGTGERCDSVAANGIYTDGRPHVLTTRSYSQFYCRDAYIVDVTYKAIDPFPGLYMSWGDTEPATEAECTRSVNRMLVWDVTSVPRVYKGEKVSRGVWVDNPDPVRNPGVSKICSVPPIRSENTFGFTVGRKYRFGMRAETGAETGTAFSRRIFTFTMAPLADRLGSNGPFVTLLPASTSYYNGTGGTHQRWPSSTAWSYKLESPDRRVALGGDLFFQDGEFFQPHRTYELLKAPNFGKSNATLIYQGTTGGLDDITCPDFKMIQRVYATPDYTYLNE
jgi:hypothetical protein